MCIKQIALAPMEGVTDFPMRLWLWMASAPTQLGTPFLRVTQTSSLEKFLGNEFAPELFSLKKVLSYELRPQIMTANANDFCRFANLFFSADSGLKSVELNCGCPSPRCAEGGAGSELLSSPRRFKDISQEIVNKLGPKRLAIKIRTGTEDSSHFSRLIEVCSKLDLERLSIHGRTRSQGYKGFADWHKIEMAAKYLNFPVWGSGDINDLLTLEERVKQAPSTAGNLIGRGALRNPWIFAELKQNKIQTISIQTLIESFTCLLFLQYLSRSNLFQLINLVGEGAFSNPALLDAESWVELKNRLCQATKHTEKKVLEKIDRASLGRVKLLWNYLRSSLPAPFFSPLVLRSSSASLFISNIGEVSKKYNSQKFPLVYNDELDWLYSGAGRGSSKESSNHRVSEAYPSLIAHRATMICETSAKISSTL